MRSGCFTNLSLNSLAKDAKKCSENGLNIVTAVYLVYFLIFCIMYNIHHQRSSHILYQFWRAARCIFECVCKVLFYIKSLTFFRVRKGTCSGCIIIFTNFLIYKIGWDHTFFTKNGDMFESRPSKMLPIIDHH